MKRILCGLLVLVLCIGVFFVTASATEEQNAVVDLDTVDWDTIDWDLMLMLEPLREWYRTQEDLNKLFSVYDKRPDWDYSWVSAVTERLLADPAAFMRALAKESPEDQETIVKALVGNTSTEFNPRHAELPWAIYSTKLSENDPAEVRQVLTLFENAVETYWGIPKTGDPVVIAVVLMAVSGLGGCLLVKKIKE